MVLTASRSMGFQQVNCQKFFSGPIICVFPSFRGGLVSLYCPKASEISWRPFFEMADSFSVGQQVNKIKIDLNSPLQLPVTRNIHQVNTNLPFCKLGSR